MAICDQDEILPLEEVVRTKYVQIIIVILTLLLLQLLSTKLGVSMLYLLLDKNLTSFKLLFESKSFTAKLFHAEF